MSEAFDSNRKANFFSELSSQLRRKPPQLGLSAVEKREKKLYYSKRIEELKKNQLKIAQLDDDEELDAIFRPSEAAAGLKRFNTTQMVDLSAMPELRLEGIVARRVDDSIELDPQHAEQPDLLARQPARRLSRSVTHIHDKRAPTNTQSLEPNDFKKLKLTKTTFGLESLTLKKQIEKEKYKEFITHVALQAKAAYTGRLEAVPDNSIFYFVVDEEFSKDNESPAQPPPHSLLLKRLPRKSFSIDRKLAEYNGFFVNNVFELSTVNWTAQGIDLKEDTSKDDNAVFRRVGSSHQILKMMLLVLLLLIGYCSVYILIYIVKVQREPAMLALLFLFESIQVITCYSLLRILQKISTDMSNTMLAIQIVASR